MTIKAKLISLPTPADRASLAVDRAELDRRVRARKEGWAATHGFARAQMTTAFCRAQQATA